MHKTLLDRFVRRSVLLLLLGVAVVTHPGAAGEYSRTEDVIYGHKSGMALTMDVFQPADPNGCAVLFMVSGGFFSAREMIHPGFIEPFVDRGYTVFAVMHGSQPKFTIPEAMDDIHRAVRFIRHNADRFEVNPEKFGITGASAGGHLSLTMGTQGREGDPDAGDPVDRESSAVQAVACLFPPTDLLNYGREGEDAVGVGVLKDFKAAFGPRSSESAEERQEYGREISPIYYITREMPPTLIIHGDADLLVPYQQAEIFVQKAREQGVTAELVRREGKAHGWAGMEKEFDLFADWFDKHLRNPEAKP